MNPFDLPQFHLFAQLWLLAQAAAGAAEKTAPPPSDPFGNMFLPLAATLMAAYFLLIRPESRKQAEQKKQLSQLKKNDRVVTAGGIIGTVTNTSPDSEDVTIRVDDNNNTRIHVLRTSISRILSSSDGSTSASDKST